MVNKDYQYRGDEAYVKRHIGKLEADADAWMQQKHLEKC